ncbi:hypothetical protein K503DRAFT_125941 [Rhizopogon vinicolor AM-OR11-026]|uniref:Uncharacterized protein n=1 Tax=Rhizopogon vinicolor AM-OR11-026 TaxID=1314800 RepID=A0A1B7NFC5_9AGAM|nr:hypothetical protein K503DRAFT_125941 [Rhizopogon vinicolor AM-OR11-026]
MPRLGALILHGVAVGVMTHGLVVIKMSPADKLVTAQKGGYTLYLTIVGLCIAWFTMVVSLGCDLLPSFTALRAAKRFCLMVSLSLEIPITFVYWSLVSFFPAMIANRTPGPTCVYTSLLLSLFLRTFFSSKINIPEEYCATYNKTFPYPLQRHNPLNVRVGMNAFACFITWGTLYLVNAVHPQRAQRRRIPGVFV